VKILEDAAEKFFEKGFLRMLKKTAKSLKAISQDLEKK